MLKRNIFKLFIFMLVCIGTTNIAYAEFDFSEDIIIAGVETAGVGSAANVSAEACNSDKCTELKQSLKAVNEGLNIYNKELVRLINQIDDKNIQKLLTKAEKLKHTINDPNNKMDLTIEKDEYAKTLDQIVKQSSLNSSHITQISNVLALQVDMRNKLLDQMKQDDDFLNTVKNQGNNIKDKEE